MSKRVPKKKAKLAGVSNSALRAEVLRRMEKQSLTQVDWEEIAAEIKAKVAAAKVPFPRSVTGATASLAAESVDLYSRDPYGVGKAPPLSQSALERDLKRLPLNQLQRLSRAVHKILGVSA